MLLRRSVTAWIVVAAYAVSAQSASGVSFASSSLAGWYNFTGVNFTGVNFTGVRGFCANRCGIDQELRKELKQGEYRCNGRLDCATNPSCVAYEIDRYSESRGWTRCTTNSKVTTGSGANPQVQKEDVRCYLKAAPESAGPSYSAVHIVLLVFGFLFAFAFCFCATLMGRTCCGPDWKEFHVDVPSEEGSRTCHPIKCGIWFPVIMICILTAALWHGVLNPVATSEQCDKGLMIIVGGVGDAAGLIMGIVICCCVVRFRPKHHNVAAYNEALQAWQHEQQAVAEQLRDVEPIEITIKPGPVQVQLSKGYHLSHIIKHLPYEQPDNIHTASLSYGGTPLDQEPHHLSAKSLRKLESSLENGATLHLTGATLRPDYTGVLPVPCVGAEVRREDFMTQLDPEDLRFHHVFAPSSYEVGCCDDRSRDKVQPSEADITRQEGAAQVQLHEWRDIKPHNGRWESREYRIEHPQGPFTCYTLDMKRNQTADRGTIQCGRIQFKDVTDQEISSDRWNLSINSERCHGCFGGEGYRNLVTTGHTKWCTQLEYFPNNTPVLTFTFTEPVTIGCLVLTSANDCPERDPAHFVLHGTTTTAAAK